MTNNKLVTKLFYHFSILTLLSISLYADNHDIPIDHVRKHSFAQKVEVNGKIIQLSNAKQSVMSLIGGHIEKYFVKTGDRVKKHQKIALINSITLSRMSSEYLSLKKQFTAINRNYQATRKLYQKGLVSLQQRSEQSSARDALLARLNTLKSQLETLGIDTKKLDKPISGYILTAHSAGIVSKILQPLHTVVTKNSKIIEIVREHSYYLKSFVPLKYASKVKASHTVSLHYFGKTIPTYITQILPAVDNTTQRIVVLSSIDNNTTDLFIDAFVPATIYFAPRQERLAVKKSALSFFNNEWVVFVPKEVHHEGKEEEDEHEHEAHEHEEVPYMPKVVKILEEDDTFVAVEGLKEGEPYVSDNGYYVKSMLLKSAMGEHGH